MGIGGLMGIEVEDNAWCKRIKGEKYSSTEDNDNFLQKIKEQKNIYINLLISKI